MAWKPTNTYPDGSAVELPDGATTDEQAACYYGGVMAALLSDLSEGNFEGEDIDKATALASEINDRYQAGAGDAIGFAALLAAMSDDSRPEDDYNDGDGDPLFGPDDTFTERHADAHRAVKAA